MLKSFLWMVILLTAFTLYSCSRKHHPARTPQPDEKNNTSLTEKKNDSLEKKVIAKRKEKVNIPKVISVNDSAAHKSVDGRYYYDVMGHRYWRNNKDGKYYLFNQSMYTNDAFKPQ